MYLSILSWVEIWMGPQELLNPYLLLNAHTSLPRSGTDLAVGFLAPKWLTLPSFAVFCGLSSSKAASELLPPRCLKSCHPGWPHTALKGQHSWRLVKPQSCGNINCAFRGCKTPVGDSPGSAMSPSSRLGLGLHTTLLHPSWFWAL